jgi:hypothetical protein
VREPGDRRCLYASTFARFRSAEVPATPFRIKRGLAAESGGAQFRL